MRPSVKSNKRTENFL